MYTLTTGAVVEKKRLVKLSGATAIHNTITSTDDPIGISEYYAGSGEEVAIKGMSEVDPVEVTAAGPFAAGVDLFAAADGKVSAIPLANATYRRVGKSIEAATADGDIVLMLPYNDGKTVTV